MTGEDDDEPIKYTIPLGVSKEMIMNSTKDKKLKKQIRLELEKERKEEFERKEQIRQR